MKLYDGGRAPNPRRVRVFLAEKGITVATEQIDLGALQQKSAAFASINPIQRVPVLVLDDGTVIAESIAICRYFEALNPDPPLFGVGAKEIAQIEMWNRRLELHLLFPVSHVFRNSHPAMKEMEVPQVRCGRLLYRRRHHRPRRHRFHEAGQAVGAGVVRQRAALACRAFQTPKRECLTMRLTIVGSGDAFGSGGRFNTCFWLETARATLMVDAGPPRRSRSRGG